MHTESDDHKRGLVPLKIESDSQMKQDIVGCQDMEIIPMDIDGNITDLLSQDENEMILIIVTNSDKETADNGYDQKIASKIHNCNICNMDFELSDDYLQHIETLSHINAEKRFLKAPCEICNKFISKTYITSHLAKHKFDPIINENECKICNIAYQCKEDLKLHQETESHNNAIKESTKIECNVCHKLLGKTYYKSHCKLHGSETEQAERQRKCPICLKYFSCTYYSDHMKRIHNICNKIKTLEEESCTNDSILAKSNIKLENSKKDKTETQYVCDICGKISKKLTGFNLHRLTHGSELNYKCMFCPYRGLHRGLLKVHVRTHTGDYNYKCTKCPAKFITKSNLNKHLKRHRGPIDFLCNTCHRGFYSKLELERHYKIKHLGIKDHKCSICGKAFGCRSHMTNHQLKVHKRKKLTNGAGRLPNYLQAHVNL